MKAYDVAIVSVVLITLIHLGDCKKEIAVAEKAPYTKVEFCGRVGGKATVLYQVADELNKVCKQVNSIDCSLNIEEFFGKENKDKAIDKINKIFCKTEFRITNCYNETCGSHSDAPAPPSEKMARVNKKDKVEKDKVEKEEYYDGEYGEYYDGYYYDGVYYNNYYDGYWNPSANNFQPVKHDEIAIGKKKIFQLCGNFDEKNATFKFPRDGAVILDLFTQLARYSGECESTNIINPPEDINVMCAVLQNSSYLESCIAYPYFMYNSMFSCKTIMYPDCVGFAKLKPENIGEPYSYDFGEEGVYEYWSTPEGRLFLADDAGMSVGGSNDATVPTLNLLLLFCFVALLLL